MSDVEVCFGINKVVTVNWFAFYQVILLANMLNTNLQIINAESLTRRPQRIPQVSKFFLVLVAAMSKKRSKRSYGVLTVRKGLPLSVVAKSQQLIYRHRLAPNTEDNFHGLTATGIFQIYG